MPWYRPTFASFLAALPISLSPAVVAAIIVWFLDPGTALKVVSALFALFALHNVIGDVFVHLGAIHVDERGIMMKGSLGDLRAIEWREVTGAVLRERENPITRTDRLLIIDSDDKRVMFNTNVLKPADEAALLAMVRRHAPLVVERDTPAV